MNWIQVLLITAVVTLLVYLVRSRGNAKTKAWVKVGYLLFVIAAVYAILRPDDTTVVANFDRLGIQVTLAGSGVSTATGSYVDGDLNTETLIVSNGTGCSFQVGPDDGINNRIEVTIDDMRASGPRLNLNTTSVATLNASRSSISTIDEAINKVSGQRGDLGAWMNRLAFTISFTENSIENIQNSEASISDADIAYEVSRFTRAQVLSQASTAMLAQANVVPQTALSLLQ